MGPKEEVSAAATTDGVREVFNDFDSVRTAPVKISALVGRGAPAVEPCSAGKPVMSDIAPDVLSKLPPDDEVTVPPQVKRIAGGIGHHAPLILFAVAMGIIALCARAESPGPVVYAQRRCGKDEKVFMIYKFRSMYMDAEARQAKWAVRDDSRITLMAKTLRKIRLDELPRFWNVLKGDTSLHILKTCPEFSGKSKGAFTFPVESSTNKGKAFPRFVDCFVSGLRTRCISEFNCKRAGSIERQFLQNLSSGWCAHNG